MFLTGHVKMKGLLTIISTSVYLAIWLYVLPGNALAQQKMSVNEGVASSYATVDAGVEMRLSSGGWVDVVVAFRTDYASKSDEIDVRVLSLEISRLNDAFLDRYSTNDFTVRQTFSHIPAIAGRLYSLDALIHIAENPIVDGIYLDIGGTGSADERMNDRDARGVTDSSVELINADEWHSQGVRGQGVVVAVIDSGLDTDHDDFAGKLIDEVCFIDNNGRIDGQGACPDGSDRQNGPGSAEDDLGHGTNVTGIINSSGIQSPLGVAPETEIVAIKIIDSNNIFRYWSELLAALNYVVENPQLGVQVVNMSLGTTAQFRYACDERFPAATVALSILKQRGVIVAASTMNNGSGEFIGAPACLSDVVGVGATTNRDEMTLFSNANPLTDVVAPGQSILSSGMFNGRSTYSGTSQAAPHVSGCAALLKSVTYGTEHSDYIDRIKQSSVTVRDARNGLEFPRLDCSAEEISVQVSSVSTSINSDRVTLAWQTFSERSNAGFIIEHRSDLAFEEVAFVAGHGTTTQRQSYSFESAPIAPGRHEFRMVQVDENGNRRIGGIIPVELELTKSFIVSEAYPNPAGSTARITISMANSAWVTVDIFDVLGRRIQSVLRTDMRAGVANTVNLKTMNMNPGVYFVRAYTASNSVTKKFIVSR